MPNYGDTITNTVGGQTNKLYWDGNQYSAVPSTGIPKQTINPTTGQAVYSSNGSGNFTSAAGAAQQGYVNSIADRTNQYMKLINSGMSPEQAGQQVYGGGVPSNPGTASSQSLTGGNLGSIFASFPSSGGTGIKVGSAPSAYNPASAYGSNPSNTLDYGGLNLTENAVDPNPDNNPLHQARPLVPGGYQTNTPVLTNEAQNLALMPTGSVTQTDIDKAKADQAARTASGTPTDSTLRSGTPGAPGNTVASNLNDPNSLVNPNNPNSPINPANQKPAGSTTPTTTASIFSGAPGASTAGYDQLQFNPIGTLQNYGASLTNPYTGQYQQALIGQGITNANQQYANQDAQLRAEMGARGLGQAGLSGVEDQARTQLGMQAAQARTQAANDALLQTTQQGANFDLSKAGLAQTGQNQVALLPGQVTSQNIDNQTHQDNLSLIKDNWQALQQKTQNGLALSNAELAQKTAIAQWAQQHPDQAWILNAAPQALQSSANLAGQLLTAPQGTAANNLIQSIFNGGGQAAQGAAEAAGTATAAGGIGDLLSWLIPGALVLP